MASKKRGNDEGSIYQRESDGRWVASVSVGYGVGADGKPRRKRVVYYGKTRAEVADKLKQAQREQDDGRNLGAPRQTIRQFLESWLTDTVKPSKQPKTYHAYSDLMRLHVTPELGRHPLDKLTPQHVAGLLRAKTDAGLSPRTVHHIRAVLRNALNQALRWGLVTRNAAALVEPPRQTAKEVTPFTVAEARTIMTAVDRPPKDGGDRLATLFRVALTLGLRQGEVLGLAWQDVDLDAGKLRIRQALQRIDGKTILKEPKTDKSRRTLTLPASLVVALRTHRDRQAFDKAAAGPRWVETGLVFTTGIGGPLNPRNVIRSWHRNLDAARLERRPFHTCRHTAASLMLAEGVPVKVVQEVLGHTLLSTTADIYGHLFPSAFQEAADAMERALAASG